MLKPLARIFHALLLLILISASGSIVYYFKTAPKLSPAATLTPVPLVSDTSIPDTGWSLLQRGLERRVIQIYDDQGQRVESVYVWRLDQKHFRLDVAFDENPKTLDNWQKETNASMVMNGGYFSIENEKYFPDGLTIINGEASGSSFVGFGGMLAVERAGAEVRWLVQEPYKPDEPLQAALQSFPILVQPGGKLGFGADRENYAKARRTVIGQDQDGRILLLVSPEGYFTLHELSTYLTDSDLQLDIAINLDGGGSTGILVTNPRETIPSRVLLPFVILVYAR